MNKKYLMKGFAALALIAGFSSCVKDVEGVDPVEQEAAGKENAELQLGLTIPDGQTWDMASQVTATVTVNGDYGANYIVNIYENNPFINNSATILGRASVVSGGTAEFTFTCPKSVVSAFAAIKDEKGYTYVKPVAVVNDKIETTFGGESAAGSRSLRAARRSAADDATIATRTMPDLSAYIDDAVAITTENNTTNPSNTVTHYLIPEDTEWSANIPLIQSGSGISVYVQGTLNINAEQRVNGGCVFIVGPKGTVNIASGQQLVTNANNEAGTVGSFYVYPGGTVQGSGTLQFANGTGSYNYNGGTIDVGTINNNGGTLYNAGTLEADIMEGGAGRSIYENAGKVHIGKCVKGSSTANTRIYNNCWWECDGDIYCRNIIQGEGAYIKGANLGMSGSEDGTGDTSYIWAKSSSLIDIPGYVAFNGFDIVCPTGDGYAYLQFGEATGTSRSDLGEAYHDKLGISMVYATAYGDNGQYMTTAISNNIRLSLDTYDLNWNFYEPSPCGKLLDMLNGTRAYTVGAYNEDQAQWGEYGGHWDELPQVGNGNAVLVQKGQVNDVVTEDECSPGIDIVDPKPIYEEPLVYTYAFEDQIYAGDYDMNDVVLKVSFPVTERNKNGEVTKIDSTKLNVTMVAAGATFKIKAYIGETALFDGKEIHDAFGKYNAAAGATQSMINTGNGKAISAEPVSDQISVPANWDGDFNKLNVWIWVNPESEAKSETKIYFTEQKKYPYAVMIPNDWAWPTERTNISIGGGTGDNVLGAYAGSSDATTTPLDGYNYPNNSFFMWARTPNAERTKEMNSWYNYPVAGKTMKVEY